MPHIANAIENGLKYDSYYDSLKDHELIVANRKLAFQTREKERWKLSEHVTHGNLRKLEITQKECFLDVKDILVDISHNIRQPVANIIGLAGVLDQVENSPESLRKLIGYIKQATISLDFFTKDLTVLVVKLESKLNK